MNFVWDIINYQYGIVIRHHRQPSVGEIVMGKVHRMTSAIDTKVGVPIYCTTSRYRGYLIVSTSASGIIWSGGGPAAVQVCRTYLRKHEK